MQPIFKKNTKNHSLLLLCITFFTFSWIAVLTQGLPIGDFDDWDNVILSHDLSWETLTVNMILPWSKSDHWDGQSGRINSSTHRRPFRTVMIKAVQEVAGFKFFPQYIAAKALFFPLTVVFLFILLCSVGGLGILSLGGLLFYLTIPAHYAHIFWISDPITMAHFFIVAGIFCYFRLWESLAPEIRPAQRWKWIVLLFLCGWMGMKTKEPALVLPLTVLIHMLFHWKLWRPFTKESVTTLFGMLWCIFLLVPIEHVGSTRISGGGFFTFNFETVSRMLFRNYACGYEDEPATAFLSWSHIWPVSIARTFGFFLLWAIILAAFIYLIFRFRNRVAKENWFLHSPIVQFSCIWLGLEIFFMGKFQPDPRYFSGAMIPLVILTVRLLSSVTKSFSSALAKRLVFMLLISSLTWTLISNLRHIIYLREWVGMRNNRMLESAQNIFRDQFPDAIADRKTIGLFYGSTYVPDASHPRIGPYLFFSPFYYESYNKSDKPSLRAYQEAAQQGAIYYLAYPDHWQPSPDAPVKRLATVDGINEESWVENLIYGIKNKKPDPLFIYKWMGNSQTGQA